MREPTSTANINLGGDIKCNNYQPISVTGSNNQITQTLRIEKDKSELSRIEYGIHDPIESFTGRKDVLAEISKIIEKNREEGKMTVLSQTNVVTGMGGVGKTETIRKYINISKRVYGHILWINAETFNESKNSFRSIAKKLKMSPEEFEKGLNPLRAIVQEIYDRLCTKPTLVVFDNVQKFGTTPNEEGIYAFLPASINAEWVKPTIIATSRIRNLKNLSVIELEGFQEVECYQLLSSQLGFEGTEENRGYASKIALLTEGLPLAIQVVIAIIRRESENLEAIGGAKYTMKDFLAEIEEHDTKFFHHEPHDSEVPQSILKIFEISFQKLQQETHGALAMKILTIMSTLSPDNIPKTLLTFLCTSETDRGQFLPNALLLLHNYNLATNKSTHYEVHRLIQRVILHLGKSTTLPTEVKPNELLPSVVQRFQTFLERMKPTSNVLDESLQNGYQLAQHIDVQSHPSQKFLQVLASKFEYHGRYSNSIKILKKQLQEKTIENPLEDLPTLTTTFHLSRVYRKSGKLAKAIELCGTVLKTRENIQIHNHPDILVTKNSLAKMFFAHGKYSEAEKLCIEVLAARENILGADHPETLKTKHDFARLFHQQGRYNGAAELGEFVLKARKTILGHNHPDTLHAMNNLGVTFCREGMYDQASKLLELVLNAQETVLGPHHLGTLMTKHNLANLLDCQGKFDEASQLYRSVITSRENILGPDHPEVLMTKHYLARLVMLQGKYNEASELGEFVLKARKTILGDNHLDTLQATNNLAATYIRQGRYDEATKLFKLNLKAQEIVRGPLHIDTLTTKINLADAFQKQGKFNEASEQYKFALKAMLNTLGENHHITLTTKNYLANVFNDQGKYDDAMNLLHSVLKARETILGHSHYFTLNTKCILAKVYVNQGKHHQAAELYQYAINVFENDMKLTHPRALDAKNGLAVVLDYQKKFNEAEQLFEYVLKERKKTLGSNHPDTLMTMHNLARVFDKQGRFNMAIELYEVILKERENILGHSHPHTVTTKQSLAMLLSKKLKNEKVRYIYEVSKFVFLCILILFTSWLVHLYK